MIMLFLNLVVFLTFILLLMPPTLLSQREFLHPQREIQVLLQRKLLDHNLRQALIHSSYNVLLKYLHYRMSYYLMFIPLHPLLQVFLQVIQVTLVPQVMQTTKAWHCIHFLQVASNIPGILNCSFLYRALVSNAFHLCSQLKLLSMLF